MALSVNFSDRDKRSCNTTLIIEVDKAIPGERSSVGQRRRLLSLVAIVLRGCYPDSSAQIVSWCGLEEQVFLVLVCCFSR
mmetsp:Transcript_13662/g.33093  ORF Transcript_13662/g.33093 Transcript_13662/m.33093 type:complete len:80 (-) Transcript_13662:63-302(-)